MSSRVTIDDLTDERADDAFELHRQRELDDAADTLRAHEEAARRQPAPIPQPCGECGFHFAGIVCPLCKTERPQWTSMKNISRRQLAEALKAAAADDNDIARIARHCGAG